MQLGRCDGSALRSGQGRRSLASHHIKSRGACYGPRENLGGGISLLGIVLQTAVLGGMEMCGKMRSNRVELVLDHAPPVIVVESLYHETVRESASTGDMRCSISSRDTGRRRVGGHWMREQGYEKQTAKVAKQANSARASYSAAICPIAFGTRDGGMQKSEHTHTHTHTSHMQPGSASLSNAVESRK
jgi:hypothetical protein